MKTHYYDLAIRVLLYKEGKRYAAHALDVDLFGYGDTEDAARKDLEDAVWCQLTFATQMGNRDLLDHPAPKRFFDQWEKAHSATLRGSLTRQQAIRLETKAQIIAMTREEVIRRTARHAGRRFEPVPELAVA